MSGRTAKIWRDGRFVEWSEATIHVMSHVVHYGSSVFEGIRCYETPAGPAIFRLPEHLRRLADSCQIYRLAPTHSLDALAQACVDTVAANELRAALDYAEAGHLVFPVRKNKRPWGDVCPNGLHDATTDADTIGRWWTRHPNAGIGLWIPDGVVVIDVETVQGHGEDGLAQLAQLQADLGSLPDTGPLAKTTTGGQHWWLAVDTAMKFYSHPWLGIDVKTHSGYVVVPPGTGR